MLQKRFLKPRISVETIGKLRFWLGIIFGIVASIVISLFINYSREALRAITFMWEPFVLSKGEFRQYDIFFAALSASYGFTATIIFWTGGLHRNVRKRYWLRAAGSNAFFVSITSLYVLSKFVTLLYFLLYYDGRYDDDLNLLNGIWYLLPLYIFFAHWNELRRVFRSVKWQSGSFGIYLLTVFYLFQTTSAPREVLNNCYKLRTDKSHAFIDKTLAEADRDYGLQFCDSTRIILGKHHARRTRKLVTDVRTAFRYGKVPSLDTLILSRILVHNINKNYKYRWYDDAKRWPYPKPVTLYMAIQKEGVNSEKLDALFQILIEEAKIFATPIHADSEVSYSATYLDKMRNDFKEEMMMHFPDIYTDCYQVIKKLKTDEKFKTYWSSLPELKLEEDDKLYLEIDWNIIHKAINKTRH